MAKRDRQENVNLRDSYEGTPEKKSRIDPKDMDISPPIVYRNPFVVDLDNLSKAFDSPDLSIRKEALSKFRDLLSKGHILHFNVAMEKGFVPYLIDFMQYRDQPEIQELSLSLLGDLVLHCSKAVEPILNNGAIDILCTFIPTTEAEIFNKDAGDTLSTLQTSTKSKIYAEIIRLLGNIAGTSKVGHWEVTKLTLRPLLFMFANKIHASFSTANNLKWTLSVLISGFGEYGADKLAELNVQGILASVKDLLSKRDEDMILPASEVLVFVASHGHIQDIMDAGLVDSLLSLAKVPKEKTLLSVQRKVFEILAVISSKANKSEIRRLVDMGVIGYTDPGNMDKSLADLSMKILYSILLDGTNEEEMDLSSFISPHGVAIKNHTGDLQPFFVLTRNKIFSNIVTILGNN